MNEKEEGVIIKSTGSWYVVRLKNGEILDARIIGKFRQRGLKLTNPVAVGDLVRVEREEDVRKCLIKEILPRQNYIVRQSPRKKHHLHLLASNIDQAVLICTIVAPNLKQGFIDRFLLMTEPHDIPVIIIFNKSDLFDEEAIEIFKVLQYTYQDIGYKVLMTSAVNGTGVEELKDILSGKMTLVCGHSGVGKSSLINVIQPGLNLKTQDISDYSGKGTHTTTFAEMFSLSSGGFIIDTPGIKTLSFNNLEPMDVAHNFREFFILSEKCKFTNCTHINEPKCAVKEGLETGAVSYLRYKNYLTIIDEISDQNYWERHHHM